jgi:hypothetical protein
MTSGRGSTSVPRARREALMGRLIASTLASKKGPAQADPPTTVLEWSERYRRIDGQPFSLQRFTPLRALYQDRHPRICVIKPAQRGVSEWAINEVCFALDVGAKHWGTNKDGLNVAYILQTRDALGDFSKERLSGLREESDYLRVLFDQEFNAVGFKKVRKSYLYLRGGWSTESLLTFPADVLVLDEYDRLDAEAIALARRRLNASEIRREIAISTPTLPGRGIDELYQSSDKMQYRQKCNACKSWVTFDFFRDVRANNAESDIWREWARDRLRVADFSLHCPACRVQWTERERMKQGEWKAQEPQRKDLRGYHIPWWPFPMADLKLMALSATSENPNERTQFFNSDLGVGYAPEGGQVTETMLAALSSRLPGGTLIDYRWRDATMGVDVGSMYHYRISARGPDREIYVLDMGEVRSWDELDKLFFRHRIRRCIVDAMPELHGAEAWASKHKKRIFRAFYPSERALLGELFRIKDDEGVIQINRTMAMDLVYATIADAAEHWPFKIHSNPMVIDQMRAPVRVIGVDVRGQPVATWAHTAPDHLFHATLYDMIARATLPRGTLELVVPQALTKGWGS